MGSGAFYSNKNYAKNKKVNKKKLKQPDIPLKKPAIRG